VTKRDRAGRKDESSTGLSLARLREMLGAHQVRRIYAKLLAPNDNSKNQPYFGGDFGVLNIIPSGTPVAARTSGTQKKPIFKAPLRFSWLGLDGKLYSAPEAKLILYPQYPEVRFSGYLAGADRDHRPSDVMGTTRAADRVLVLGVRDDRTVIGFAAGPESRLARELKALRDPERAGVFVRVPIFAGDTVAANRALLLEQLCRIARLGWIDSKRLDGTGSLMPCDAPHCGGYTLEAQLGITPNGLSQPDLHGWEIKTHTVKSFERDTSSRITLMTPEPTGGFYTREGVIAFVEKYGYPDVAGREGRLNFGGSFRRGVRLPRTGLRLELLGYDAGSGRITDPAGGIALIDDDDVEAAVWRFADLLGHWGRKHALAIYVPTMRRELTARQYRYSDTVRMGTGTTFDRFLSAVCSGKVIYDPGIKVEGYPDHLSTKRRSQFRLKSGELSCLYESFERRSSCQEEQSER
jgi:hypothetical protein